LVIRKIVRTATHVSATLALTWRFVTLAVRSLLAQYWGASRPGR
jgi:hypothetical protein